VSIFNLSALEYDFTYPTGGKVLAGIDGRFVEMASTGEIAAFGKNVPEAYWNAYLSTNSFKPPKRGSGVLIGGDLARPELGFVAKGLVDLGFSLYTSNQQVTDALNSIPYVVSLSIFHDRRESGDWTWLK